jgi:hypothetical protein
MCGVTIVPPSSQLLVVFDDGLGVALPDLFPSVCFSKSPTNGSIGVVSVSVGFVVVVGVLVVSSQSVSSTFVVWPGVILKVDLVLDTFVLPCVLEPVGPVWGFFVGSKKIEVGSSSCTPVGVISTSVSVSDVSGLSVLGLLSSSNSMSSGVSSCVGP